MVTEKSNAVKHSVPRDESRIGKGKPGPGRPKGVPNAINRDLKEMIRGALDKAGGVDYLARQAEENPAAFMSLVGKTLPKELTGANGGPLEGRFTVSVEWQKPGT
jgi:hypothetical protein